MSGDNKDHQDALDMKQSDIDAQLKQKMLKQQQKDKIALAKQEIKALITSQNNIIANISDSLKEQGLRGATQNFINFLDEQTKTFGYILDFNTQTRSFIFNNQTLNNLNNEIKQDSMKSNRMSAIEIIATLHPWVTQEIQDSKIMSAQEFHDQNDPTLLQQYNDINNKNISFMHFKQNAYQEYIRTTALAKIQDSQTSNEARNQYALELVDNINPNVSIDEFKALNAKNLAHKFKEQNQEANFDKFCINIHKQCTEFAKGIKSIKMYVEKDKHDFKKYPCLDRRTDNNYMGDLYRAYKDGETRTKVKAIIKKHNIDPFSGVFDGIDKRYIPVGYHKVQCQSFDDIARALDSINANRSKSLECGSLNKKSISITDQAKYLLQAKDFNIESQRIRYGLYNELTKLDQYQREQIIAGIAQQDDQSILKSFAAWKVVSRTDEKMPQAIKDINTAFEERYKRILASNISQEILNELNADNVRDPEMSGLKTKIYDKIKIVFNPKNVEQTKNAIMEMLDKTMNECKLAQSNNLADLPKKVFIAVQNFFEKIWNFLKQQDNGSSFKSQVVDQFITKNNQQNLQQVNARPLNNQAKNYNFQQMQQGSIIHNNVRPRGGGQNL